MTALLQGSRYISLAMLEAAALHRRPNLPERNFAAYASEHGRPLGWRFYPQVYLGDLRVVPDMVAVLVPGYIPTEPLPRAGLCLIELDGAAYHLHQAKDAARDRTLRDLYGLDTWRGNSVECTGPYIERQWRAFRTWAEAHLADRAENLRLHYRRADRAKYVEAAAAAAAAASTSASTSADRRYILDAPPPPPTAEADQLTRAQIKALNTQRLLRRQAEAVRQRLRS